MSGCCLQHLSEQTCLDISSAVSVAHEGQETTYAEFDCLHNSLQHDKDTSKLGICLYPVRIDDITVVILRHQLCKRPEQCQPAWVDRDPCEKPL